MWKARQNTKRAVEHALAAPCRSGWQDASAG
ncbi:MAG: hypothetical protein ACJAWY_002181, partial [Sphingomonas echinoides]